ncbi:MAG: oxepin-CoA hydrolase/3-oxo-5,6-dehydrosuberyl-CoA semialdehyde dehydrogenase [Flavobacteriales bacterium]|jgi:oxepin-CoA hydrolase/3-oxo-5,6-dehydrosuberyl-CoA semialdehyde dehydrogenase
MAKFPESNTINFDNLFELSQSTDQPLWGTMTLQHMVEHLELVYSRCYDANAYEIVSPAEKLGKLKVFLKGKHALVRNFNAPFIPNEPVPYKYKSLAEATSALLNARKAFNAFFADKSADFTVNHIVFGALTYPEWTRFHDKHVGHHLAQFGMWNLEA